MSAAETSIVHMAGAILLMIVIAYAAGRIHQWYRHSLDRDQAFQKGYSHASHTLFPLAARARRAPADHAE